ncbi:hypothetical protein Tco_0709190 [Tanacetum coccineum]
MAAPGAGNQVARRVIDNLVDLSGETCPGNVIGQLNALIAEMEAFEDQGKVFDTLMGITDDRRVEETKLAGLNDLITQGEEEIEMKEAQLENVIFVQFRDRLLFDMLFDICVATLHNLAALGVWVADNAFQNLFVAVYTYVTVVIYAEFPLGRLKAPKLSEVDESPRLADKMKYVFGRSRAEDESFAKLVCDLCFALRTREQKLML